MRSSARKTRRPMSPNIQIYRPQLTSVLSIANRISGVVTSAGAIGLVRGSLLQPLGLTPMLMRDHYSHPVWARSGF